MARRYGPATPWRDSRLRLGGTTPSPALHALVPFTPSVDKVYEETFAEDEIYAQISVDSVAALRENLPYD